MIVGSSLAAHVSLLGMRTLCWNNFGNNRMAKELRIIPE